ncbi:Protein GLUTAMINE DUMPER 4 [Striga hermonthica]|uniref:Protein GLUTAMINE DUMPER 4 n=1 Tax=Striga hermonthica TaxID=68872 RepID=A0A9N7NDC2_STRHE|nr:Protein GLUTAMINE DUMPER 4 [Striga hermonthica]
MRPAPSAPKTTASWHWDSPLPYLFAGLGLMLLLITGALLVLACSYRKRQSREADYGGDKPAQPPVAASGGGDTPKIVVIMAGDDNPTHLAVPIKV